LREEFGNRKPASKTVAVLADPVFSADDARLAQATKIAGDSSPLSMRSDQQLNQVSTVWCDCGLVVRKPTKSRVSLVTSAT